MKTCKKCNRPFEPTETWGHGSWCPRCQMDELVYNDRADLRRARRERARFHAAYLEAIQTVNQDLQSPVEIDEEELI